MNYEDFFRQVRNKIAEKDFASLNFLPVPAGEKFNWVSAIFENIHVKENPKVDALIWTNGRQTKRFSFEDLNIQYNRLLNFLRNKGIQTNAVLFCQIPLLPENWLTILASIKGGLRLIPAATVLTVNDIVYRFDKLMPDVVLADNETASKIDEAEKNIGKKISLKIIVDSEREGWFSFNEINREGINAIAADTNANDPLFLFFTSGTTGMPKIVTHTHTSYPLGHLTTASWIGIKVGDIHYNISQPGWAKFAWSSFFAPWSVGATVFAFHPYGKFNAHEQLSLIEQYKITTFCAPPTALRMLILADFKPYSFSLRECVAAGEPLNPEIIETWKKGTGLIIRDGYGQTESSCIVANLPNEKIKFGSMGRPTFLYDIIIADEEGNEMPLNEEGNIAVKTDTGKPNGLFTEYFGDPGKKKEVFKFNLYYTGDKAYKDEDGYIWFVGRDDDVIKTSDYRVGPFEVESILLEHPSVVESAVVGSPHPVKGFVVKAFVVLNTDSIPDHKKADEIFRFAKKNLAPYKIPRIIEFVKELPKTISGKIRRVELRAAEGMKVAQNRKAEAEYHF
jgi:acyl-coenzyme A synthetase/AMP-(fatty) acid ligase